VPNLLPTQWVRGIKRPGRETDQSPPSSSEVKNAWSYTSIPPYVFKAWCLLKHRDFIFTFTFLACQKTKRVEGASSQKVLRVTFTMHCKKQTWRSVGSSPGLLFVVYQMTSVCDICFEYDCHVTEIKTVCTFCSPAVTLWMSVLQRFQRLCLPKHLPVPSLTQPWNWGHRWINLTSWYHISSRWTQRLQMLINKHCLQPYLVIHFVCHYKAAAFVRTVYNNHHLLRPRAVI
jgi:hypothetical protein